MSAITRRQIAGYGVGLASAILLQRPAMATAPQTISLRDGNTVTALGQGSARLGQGKRAAAEEEEALKAGIALGMTVIDTAEVYGSGKSEELIGRAIAGKRDAVFLVSKVWPTHATAAADIRAACTASRTRLGIDHLDLYLLHWRKESKDLAIVVETFEQLRAEGAIRRWGVSNFKVADMEELFGVRSGENCAINQVPYSLADRAIERELLPWCDRHRMPIMAYSPLGGHGSNVLKNPALARIGSAQGASAAAVALAWAMRSGNTLAIPESGSVAHVRENAAALTLKLTAEDLKGLDTAFPM